MEYMLKIMAMVFILTACDADAPTSGIGQTVTHDCGAAPLAPGWAVAHNSGRTSMTDTDFAAIESWRSDVYTWQSCVVDHP